MTDAEKSKKLEELLNNEGFLQEIGNAESKEAVQKTFGNYGLDLTRDEVDAILEISKVAAEKGELDEKSLTNVSGGWGGAPGWIIGTALNLVKFIWKGAGKLGRELANWEDRH